MEKARAALPEIRRRLLQALVPFLKGETSQSLFDDEFVEIWDATEEPDQALSDLCELVWRSYSDFSNETVAVEPARYRFLVRAAAWLQTELDWRAEKKRYGLFLKSWLPEWPTDEHSPFESAAAWAQHEHLARALGLTDTPPPVKVIPYRDGGPPDSSFKLVRGRSFRLTD